MKKLEIAALVLLGLLFFVWPMPRTISLRDLLLVLVLLVSGYRAWRRGRSRGNLRALFTPAIMIAALTAWMYFVAFFISPESAWSIDELNSQWIRALVALVAGVVVAMAVGPDSGLKQKVLLVIFAELAALGLKRWQREKLAYFASAGLGAAGLVCLLETGEHGGRLVYAHAGGVGIREGKPEDVGRLLLAGLYFQAQVDRKAGRPEDAAVLIELATKRFGSDTEVQLLAAEALGRISVPPDKRRLRSRHALLTADALAASGQKDGARAALQQLLAEYPDDPRLRKKLEELGGR